MQNLTIGLTGLNAASTALEIIGNNIANASTDGYHRQRVELAPSTYGRMGGGDVVGAGVDVASVTRLVDKLLEAEILQQGSSYEQISQELSILSGVETTFGEFSEDSGLNATIDGFFDALRGLAAHPLERVWRNDTISSAEVMCNEFRRLGESLENLEDQVVMEARNAGDSINSLITQIAELNSKIQIIEISQGTANNLRDHRDRLVTELGKLVNIETQEREYGIVDVAIGGLPVVTGSITVGVEVGRQDDGSLGISAAGNEGNYLDVEGGRFGALMSLKNDLLLEVGADLDTLAQSIVNQVNRYHVQGLGVDGSFTELSSAAIDATEMPSGGAAVIEGEFYIRVTNTATGAVERHAIDVNVTTVPPDTPTTIAAKINTIPGLSSSVVSSRLHIMADLGYTFDFLPAVLPDPETPSFALVDHPTVSLSGIYNGDENQTLTFTIAGTGSVGNGTLRIDATDEGGSIVGTLNIGQGYAAGDVVELSNGVKLALSTGQVQDGDSFTVQALATSDTSGFLAAVGMNSFFVGGTASEMRVRSDIADSPNRIATCLGSDLTDNLAALQLAAVRDETVENLSGMTPSEYYHRIVANIGQEVSLRESRQNNVEAMVQNLEKRRGEISDVNINDEAAQLMLFENMFQAMAKYLTTIQTTMTTLMNMV